jgi:hypothetical protein
VLAFIGLFADGFGQEMVLLRHLQFITLCTAVLPQGLARLLLADSQLIDDRLDSLSARSWVYQFFDATSLRMEFSRA